MSAVDKKLQELGITLPTPAAPVANYVPFVRTGNLIVISGQLCLGADGKIAEAHKGKLGRGDLARDRARRPRASAPSTSSRNCGPLSGISTGSFAASASAASSMPDPSFAASRPS